MKHVWGYTAINDVTARDWQQRHKQWFLGKSFDTFCPMGPWVVTADQLDANDISVKCWVNGELRQNSNTKDLIFDIPNMIATVSAGITLYPESKATPTRAVDMIEAVAAQRVWLNSACDWGHSDPLSVPKAAQEMRRRGHSATAIDNLVYGNPVKFLSQNSRFKAPAAQA